MLLEIGLFKNNGANQFLKAHLEGSCIFSFPSKRVVMLSDGKTRVVMQFPAKIERRSVTSSYHCSQISG